MIVDAKGIHTSVEKQQLSGPQGDKRQREHRARPPPETVASRTRRGTREREAEEAEDDDPPRARRPHKWRVIEPVIDDELMEEI